MLPLVLEAMGHYFSWVLNFGIHFHFPGERIRMLSLLYSHKRNGKIPNKCDVHENYKCKLKEPKVLLHYLLSRSSNTVMLVIYLQNILKHPVNSMRLHFVLISYTIWLIVNRKKSLLLIFCELST